MTNAIINVNYDNDNPTVSGRELHAALGINTAYKDWFPRMCEYGFKEGTDFCSFLSESTGGRPAMEHQLTIPMAKEICMIQRTDIGRMYRQYFIKIESDWNNPEVVMARALKLADKKIIMLITENQNLKAKNELLISDILKWADRPLLNAMIRRYASYACNGEFALAWVDFKKELLYKYSVNINSRITAYLNKTGKKVKPKTLDMLADEELTDALRTIVSMCEAKSVDISDLLNKHKCEIAI